MTKQARSTIDPRQAVVADVRSSNGVALLITVLILFVVSLLGVTLVRLGSVDFALSGNYRASTAAFHLAESGLATAAADLRADFDTNPTDNWVRDWINTGTSTPTVISPFPDPTATTVNGYSLTEATVPSNPYAGTPYSLGAPSALGSGSFTRIVWLPPQIAVEAGVASVVFNVRSIGADANPATPSLTTLDGVVRVALGETVAPGGGAMFIGSEDNSGHAIRGTRVTLAGPVLVTGDGDTRFHLSGSSRVVNNYLGIDHASQGLGLLATKLPALDGTDFNGETVQTLNAVLRLKDASIQMGGQSSVGEADNPGDGYKETLDGFFTDAPPNGNNNNINADASGGFDLGEDVTFPSLYDPYVDENGTAYAAFEDYLDANAYSPGLGGDLIIDGETASFAYVDPLGKGSIAWNAATQVLTIDGVIKITGQAKIGKTGDWDPDDEGGGVIGAVKYAGTGTIWATDKIEISTNLYPDGQYLEDGPDLDGLVDGDLTLVASSTIEIQSGWSDPNVRIIASLFAEQRIAVKEPANIAGTVTTAFFEGHGSDRINVWYVPMLAGAGAFGSEVASDNLTIEVSLRDWFQRR